MRGSVDQLGQCSKDQGERLERWSECSDGERVTEPSGALN